MNILTAGALIDLELLDQAAHQHPDPDTAEAITVAAVILRQLRLPWLAAGQSVCRLCCESPADNNQLRTELLAAQQQTIQPAPLEHNELVAALAKANQRIGHLNSKVHQLELEKAAA